MVKPPRVTLVEAKILLKVLTVGHIYSQIGSKRLFRLVLFSESEMATSGKITTVFMNL